MPAKWKIKEVEELARKIAGSDVIALAGIEGLPSRQMQEIRKKLHGRAEIKVVKNRLLKLALGKAEKPGLPELEKNVEGQTALIFSDENPFKLYQMFARNRVKAPAKAGQTAPEDIVIPAGDTPFKPGPIIGDLQQVGIKAKVQGQIIAVVEDSPVIKAGEEFSQKLAGILSQLDILPMEIGIGIHAALEGGVVYGRDVLDVDPEKVLADIVAAHRSALSLAVEVGVYNRETVPLLMLKAASNARNLAIGAEIYTPESVDHFLLKADGHARGLAAAASYAPGAPPKEEAPKEERKEEEKREEATGEKPEEKAEEKPEEKAGEKPAEDVKEEKEGEPGEEAKEEAKEEPAEEKKEAGDTTEKTGEKESS